MKTISFTILGAALSSIAAAGPISARGANWAEWPEADSPFHFSSVYHVVATPDQVINGTTSTPGEPGAIGYFNYGINVELDVICYVSTQYQDCGSSTNAFPLQNITLEGVTGAYQSPAVTATHIHEAANGATGPPRIAFPNPLPIGDDSAVVRRSVGCLTGPFLTGVLSNGIDTGTAFTVKDIEENPAGFFTDSHTARYVPGVVRGQLA
jgi:hypothetical protein